MLLIEGTNPSIQCLYTTAHVHSVGHRKHCSNQRCYAVELYIHDYVAVVNVGTSTMIWHSILVHQKNCCYAVIHLKVGFLHFFFFLSQMTNFLCTHSHRRFQGWELTQALMVTAKGSAERRTVPMCSFSVIWMSSRSNFRPLLSAPMHNWSSYPCHELACT